jgi:hypothetical protein
LDIDGDVRLGKAEALKELKQRGFVCVEGQPLQLDTPEHI